MPYIQGRERVFLDACIAELGTHFDQLSNRIKSGNTNYLITKLLIRIFNPVNYNDFNEIHGIISCVDKEFYRRLTSIYEDEKIKENGDIL